MTMIRVASSMILLAGVVSAADPMVANVASFLSVDFKNVAKAMMAQVSFETFGKMDSAAYRIAFEETCARANISSTVRNIVILFSVMIKNRDRVIRAIEGSTGLLAIDEVMEAKAFLTRHCTNYVTNQRLKYPFVKIPESFASLSAVYFAAFNDEASVTAIFSTTWFSHLPLSQFLQDLAEMYMRFLWTQIITSTKNTGASRDSDRSVGTFYPDIYDNAISDSEAMVDYEGDPYTRAMVKVGSVIAFVNWVRTQSGLPPLAANKKILLPPREDWRFFHPKFQKDPAITTHDAMIPTGDYNAVGEFEPDRATGFLSAWMASFATKVLPKARSQTTVKIGDITTVYKFA